MLAINIGDNSTNGAPRVPIDCPAGATITVSVVAASAGPLICEQYPDDPSPSTITAGNSSTFTSSFLASSPGSIASIQVSGGNY